MKFGNKVAKKILDLWVENSIRKKESYFSHQVEYEISSLNPGINGRKLVYEHYLGKISQCLMVLAVGIVFVLLYVVSAHTGNVLKKDRLLERNPVGSVEKTVVLDAQIGDVSVKGVSIPVSQKVMDQEEAKALLDEIAGMLPEKILGDNVSTDHINKPLTLMNTWDEAPVSIFWDSSNYAVLQNDGSFGNQEVLEEGMEIVLTATLTYEDVSKEEQIPVKVYPPDLPEEERLERELLSLVEESQKKDKSGDYLELPDTVDNTEVIWREPKAELVPVLLLMLGGTVIAVFLGKDRELHKEYEERDRQLLLEYSEFVSKLQLLFCSGMSIRSAFVRIGTDYQKSLKKGGKKKYVCEELLLAVRKMENGMSEAEAMEYFGKRCHLFCYKKLVSLVLQNLKRGSEGLRDALLNETKAAFEERKQTARRMGEEAGTKLLLPMMLMMGVILVIIVVPAYFSFGGI